MAEDLAPPSSPPTTVPVAELARAGRLDLGVTAWRVIDQARVDAFADATDDHQWIHVDPERAAAGPFGGAVAHGYLTLAIAPALLKELLVIPDQVRGTNYGLERVRFISPVLVGSQVRLAATLISAEPRPDGGVRYHVGLTMQVRGVERPAMIAEAVYVSYEK